MDSGFRQPTVCSLAARYDNVLCCTGPPDYICWRNRFLDFINVYKYGLRACRLRDHAVQYTYKCINLLVEILIQRMYDMNRKFQMQGGKNWILPKEINANLFFWDSHWLEIWPNHFCPSIGPNGGSVAMDSVVYAL
jgi:hypothetical protein